MKVTKEEILVPYWIGKDGCYGPAPHPSVAMEFRSHLTVAAEGVEHHCVVVTSRQEYEGIRRDMLEGCVSRELRARMTHYLEEQLFGG